MSSRKDQRTPSNNDDKQVSFQLNTPEGFNLATKPGVKQFIIYCRNNGRLDDIIALLTSASSDPSVDVPIWNVFKKTTGIKQSNKTKRAHATRLIEEYLRLNFLFLNEHREENLIERAFNCKLIPAQIRSAFYVFVLTNELFTFDKCVEEIKRVESFDPEKVYDPKRDEALVDEISNKFLEVSDRKVIVYVLSEMISRYGVTEAKTKILNCENFKTICVLFFETSGQEIFRLAGSDATYIEYAPFRKPEMDALCEKFQVPCDNIRDLWENHTIRKQFFVNYLLLDSTNSTEIFPDTIESK